MPIIFLHKRCHLRRWLLSFFGGVTLLLALPAHGQDANPCVYPGGIALVETEIERDNPPVAAWFGSRRVWLELLEERAVALVGLDAGLIPGSYVLTLKLEDGQHIGQPFQVRPRLTETSAADLPEGLPPQNLPSPIEVLPKQWLDFYTDPPPAPPQNLSGAPLEALYVFNYMGTHPYISYLTPPGAAIYAPLSGQVMDEIQTQYGNALVLHHGQSLLSVVQPLQRISVQVGEPISAGQQLGVSGAPPQASSEWLDWALLLNGTPIDPDALLSYCR